MAKKTSGEVSNKPAKKASSKPDMSLQQAFSIVRKCDAEIKEIYATRTGNVFDLKTAIEQSVMKAQAAFMIMGFSGGAGLALATGVVPFVLVGVAPFFLTILASDTTALHKFLRPLKARKLQAEYNIYEQLAEFHEETMAEQAAEVLKKAKKAMKTINKFLREDAQELYYDDTRGKEGFAFKEPETVDQFEVAFLRLSNKNTQAQLESFKSDMKALDSTKAA